MAETVKIRLTRGPCDGQNATVERTGNQLPDFTCKSVEYAPTGSVLAGGRVVYTPKTAHPPPPPSLVGSDAKPVRAHSAWHHLLRTAFVDAPKELQRSAQARHALRLLRHRKGLR